MSHFAQPCSSLELIAPGSWVNLNETFSLPLEVIERVSELLTLSTECGASDIASALPGRTLEMQLEAQPTQTCWIRIYT
jgi:hypothetical protein